MLLDIYINNKIIQLPIENVYNMIEVLKANGLIEEIRSAYIKMHDIYENYVYDERFLVLRHPLKQGDWEIFIGNSKYWFGYIKNGIDKSIMPPLETALLGRSELSSIEKKHLKLHFKYRRSEKVLNLGQILNNWNIVIGDKDNFNIGRVKLKLWEGALRLRLKRKA